MATKAMDTAQRSTFSADELTLLATLHQVGDKVRLASDSRFFGIIGKAAETYPAFGAFLLHPVYRDSRRLRELLQMLDEGAAIVRENASIGYFKIAPPLAGALGERALRELADDPGALNAVNAVADELKTAFAGPLQIGS